MTSHETIEPIWSPTEEFVSASRVEDFRRWVNDEYDADVPDYPALLSWSVDRLEDFWDAIWRYFDVLGERGDRVLGESGMPGAEWFPGTTTNFVDQVFRVHAGTESGDAEGTVAIHERAEPGGPASRDLTYAELQAQVAGLAGWLQSMGVREGDRVVGYLPNIAEAVVGFLAAASIGAIWSGCGQDYSAQAAVDRLGQLEPRVLIAADGYRYASKDHDRRPAIASLREGLGNPATLVVSRLGLDLDDLLAQDGVTPFEDAAAGTGDAATDPVQVPFDHPLWVLFSSGTTGKPKGIVHGHGGVLLEHLKQIALHSDLGPGDVFFWYTSPSWMMWNYQVAGLLVGATIVCYDGSPGHPDRDQLWQLAAELQVKVLGTSPAYLQACERNNLNPGTDHDLSALRVLGVTGSVLPPASFGWVLEHVGDQVAVAPISGGTDVVSAFVGWVPTAPVWRGELSVVCLGTALAAFDHRGRPVQGEVGELVVTKPMPSMPLYFWRDEDGTRYAEAYFDLFPGIWRHGDWITITDHGSVVIHGRSDSTLNRQGVRMGSADIYAAVEPLEEVAEALVVGLELLDGNYWMPLFVVLAEGIELDDALADKIRSAIRTTASPRHVPDDIIAVPAIPHTRTGKKLEVPIKRILQGQPVGDVVDPKSVDDAALLEVFAAHARTRSD
ncbi:acetoacetate--CoA ligase [Granulicoccus sp. GXG6511]|uniref:acetoacetate--CoA ligase n=1 Tax=Granulicoccus sp. GXG6511 TaxID=3381351 RepID=UPI003D7C7231